MTKPKEQYDLLFVWGGVEPHLVGQSAKTWRGFEVKIVRFLRSGDYSSGRDGLFFIKLDGQKRIRDVCAFTNDFIEELTERAKRTPAKVTQS